MIKLIFALLLMSFTLALNITTEQAISIIEGLKEVARIDSSLKPAKDDNMNSIMRVADAEFAGGSYPVVHISNLYRTDYARLCRGDGITCSSGCVKPGDVVVDVEDFTSKYEVSDIGVVFHLNPVCFDSISFQLGPELSSGNVTIPLTAELLEQCGATIMTYGDNKKCARFGYDGIIQYGSIWTRYPDFNVAYALDYEKEGLDPIAFVERYCQRFSFSKVKPTSRNPPCS
ncbi:hypothetical protein BGW41_003900 [Actinomortierella wolfii]|nr:hypothetical protein BGW41_003900 [Actinomortierella wolfii]